ncbi:MAG: hypothetical protein WC863_02590 [Patescibacteria group bacterium]
MLNLKRYYYFSFVLLALFFLGVPEAGRAQLEIDPNFNPDNIITDREMLSYDAMSLGDIQRFLENKGSYLANYSTLNTHGDQKTAAEIIYDATHNNYDCDDAILSDSPTENEKKLKCQKITTINPKALLVLLQKEESLIEDSNPPQSHLDWATGYFIYDGMLTCTPYDRCWRYKGFGKQVNSAALQFLAYMQQPTRYNYRAGQTYSISSTVQPYLTTANQTMLVTPQNQATAALYNYTPHVFNGNYNFYKLWNRYFPKSSQIYPDGSLLQARGNPGVWLIENGKKRGFTNYSAFVSRFKPSQIVKVEVNDLDYYATGEPIRFANYSLVQTPDKKIYLLVDKEKRLFADQTVFKKFGFNPVEIENAAPEDLVDYKIGKTITATSTYVTGVLLQDSKNGSIYYVEDKTKAAVDKILLTTKYVGKKILKKTTKELETYKTIAPVLLDEGQLAKTDNFPTIYLISGGRKRPFADDQTFNRLGYNPKNVITASSQFLYNYDMGETIK